MQYQGQAIQCSFISELPGDSKNSAIMELRFDLKNESVNKFNATLVREFREVIDQIKKTPSIQGLLLTSAKDGFIVGADVTEFLNHFKKTEAELASWLKEMNQTLCDLEDLPFPTVTAINGFAFGGGFEAALATSYRVMAADTKIGLPETKLGIFPGWGGTVRLSRLCGADTAIEWIASGDQWKADIALKVGAVDAVVPSDQVRAAAIDLLLEAIAGRLDWKARQQEKQRPLKLNQTEATLVFEGAKAFVLSQAGPHYPAPLTAIEVIQKGSTLPRDQALEIETTHFVKIAKTPTAHALVSVFLGDQQLKKNAKRLSADAKPVQSTAVLGAGIMGGGIAYTSASRGTPVLMKDIQPKALELGMAEAIKLLEKRVSRNQLTPAKMGQTLSQIRPTLSFADFQGVDLVVEAVIEREDIKKKVLAETESQVKETTVLASNTSTISITRLAEGLKRPENFCGIHFFNPVHRMPLVEVIRGQKTSPQTIATAVAYATAIGKSVIVVNDCAGFLINRVLFPYFAGFQGLLADGVDYARIDQVMEKFGWPMGPAYLLDVVGIDTAVHADRVMSSAYPDRMKHAGKSAIEVMVENNRFGQKNSVGFYQYISNPKGAPKKQNDPGVSALIQTVVHAGSPFPNSTVTNSEIVDRMMLPMLIESSRCLEEKIVDSAVDVDLGLIYGLGFPPFRGGIFRYADSVGLQKICQTAQQYRRLGKLYEPTQQMQLLAEQGKSFYTHD